MGNAVPKTPVLRFNGSCPGCKTHHTALLQHVGGYWVGAEGTATDSFMLDWQKKYGDVRLMCAKVCGRSVSLKGVRGKNHGAGCA